MVMAWGYITAGAGPYPHPLRAQMRKQQRSKLYRLTRRPRSEMSRLYRNIPLCRDSLCCEQPTEIPVAKGVSIANIEVPGSNSMNRLASFGKRLKFNVCT